MLANLRENCHTPTPLPLRLPLKSTLIVGRVWQMTVTAEGATPPESLRQQGPTTQCKSGEWRRRDFAMVVRPPTE